MSVTGQVLKLTKGAYSLDLASGNYEVGQDFAPPPQSIIPQYAPGTSLNRTGGAALVGTKAVNRDFSFGVTITADSEAEVAQSVALIQSFLNLAGDPNEPLYLEWRGNADVSYESTWGQYGANKHYEIVYGQAVLAATYGVSDFRSRTLFDCRVNLTIKPFALGKKQRLTSVTGGIVEDTIGAADMLPRGTIIAEAVTNKMTNPAFSHATWNNRWAAGTSLVAAQNIDARYVLFWLSSAKLFN